MKQIFGIVLITALTLFTGCKEQGCTDIFADNYSASAEENDGSCVYGVDLAFYFNDSRAAFYDDAGAYSPIKVEVNGTEVGEVTWFYPFEEAPTCEPAPGVVNYKLEMSSKFEMTEFRFIDQMDNVIANKSMSIAISDGDCQAILF